MTNRSKAPALVAAGVVAIVAIITLRLLTGGDTDGSPAATPAADPSCTALTVMASSEKAALLQVLAEEFNASQEGDDCANVTVTSKASGAALDALSAREWNEADGPRPDVWSPAATSWLRLLTQNRTSADLPAVTPDDAPSVANTPLVIAMPRPMAEALGWPEQDLGWGDLADLSADPRGWGAHDHPEWGAFKLGKTNPNFSTSGLNATVGAYYAATGLSSDLSVDKVNDPATLDFVRASEAGIVHYGDTTLTFLENLARADREGRGLSYVSAVTLEEKSLWDYNTGNPSGDPTTRGDSPEPTTPLVAFYPKEGTLYSDNPYAVLTAPWVDDAKRAAAESFFGFLTSDSAQESFKAAAFRGADATPGDLARPELGIIADQPSVVLSPPSPPVLAAVKDAWGDARKRASVLLVMDVSGSMADSSGSGGSKLELAKRAALNALDDFAPDDEVGLWIFSTERSGLDPYLELVPPAQLSGNIDELRSRIEGLTPEGGTALYATARASVRAMEERATDDRINAVVLLTDGRNEYPEDTDLDSLVRDLDPESESASVRLFTIGYGRDADLPTLTTMSQASQAAAYDASDPETIDAVFTAVVSNF